MLDTNDTNDTHDDYSESNTKSPIQQPVPPEPDEAQEFDSPVDQARERKRRITQASVKTDIFRQLSACPAEVWFKIMTLANLAKGETRGVPISWLDYGRALALLEDPNQPELDPSHPEFKRAQDACRKRGSRAWEDICTWETETGWRHAVRDIGGQTADGVNEKSKFGFPLLDIMDETFEEAKTDERARDGFDGNAVYDIAVTKIACLKSPETPVQILQEHITRPNTAKRKATVARAITTLNTIEQDYRLDRTGFFKVYDWVNARTSEFAILPFTQTDRSVSEGDFASVVAWVQTHAPEFGYVVDVTPVDDGPDDDGPATGPGGLDKSVHRGEGDPCTYSSSSYVQGTEGGDAQVSDTSKTQGIESPKSAFNVCGDGEAPVQPNAKSCEMEVTDDPSSITTLNADFSSSLTQKNASYSTLTLEGFADYTQLLKDFLVCLGIGMRKDRREKDYLGIPHLDTNGALLGIKQRVRLNGKVPYVWVEGDAGLYGADWGFEQARETGRLIICEGITDQLTFRWHGMPAVGLSGASYYRSVKAEHLVGITSVVICRDADDDQPAQAGIKMATNLSHHLLDDLGFTGDVFVVKFNGVKDASEFHKLVEGDRAAFKAAYDTAYENRLSMCEAAEIDRAYEARRLSGYDWVAEQKLFVVQT